MISSTYGFSILRNWKTFNTLLWLIRPSGGPDVRVAEAPERKKRLVLRSEAGEVWDLDLRGAKFADVSSSEVAGSYFPEKFVRFLEIRLRDEGKGELSFLLAEYKVAFGTDLVM